MQATKKVESRAISVFVFQLAQRLTSAKINQAYKDTYEVHTYEDMHEKMKCSNAADRLTTSSEKKLMLFGVSQ